jgi:ApbE superfamily uncharacterized protein (UPF0280 family)
MEAFLAEEAILKQGFGPVDLAGAQTGARISLAKGQRVAIVIQVGVSAASTNIFTLKQHDAAAGGTSKVLAVSNPYFHKADVATVFTKVVPGAPASAYDLSALLSTVKGVVVLEVLAEDLDVNADFNHVSLDTTAAGVAKLGAALYIIDDPKFLPAYSQSV